MIKLLVDYPITKLWLRGYEKDNNGLCGIACSYILHVQNGEDMREASEMRWSREATGSWGWWWYGNTKITVNGDSY